jgi:hypothetical protein
VADENAEAPLAPVGTSVSFGPRGFDISGVNFPAKGLEGLSTFGDSLSGR